MPRRTGQSLYTYLHKSLRTSNSLARVTSCQVLYYNLLKDMIPLERRPTARKAVIGRCSRRSRPFDPFFGAMYSARENHAVFMVVFMRL